LPVGKDKSTCRSWSEMVEKFTKRLSLWKANSLSIGGRFILTKSILGSLPLYYLSLYRAPNKVIDTLERVRSRFDLGGLGVGSIKAKNMSLLGKWWWRFRCEKHVLWCKVIVAIHGADGGLSTWMGACLKRNVWDGIISCGSAIDDFGISFRNSFRPKIGNGEAILFWKDEWYEVGLRLMDKFPRLYALEVDQNCFLNTRWRLVDGNWCICWNWRAPVLTKIDDRGIDIPSVLCPLCEDVPESLDHILVACPKAFFFITMWDVWTWRNKIVHSKVEDKLVVIGEDIFALIQSNALLWISNRFPKGNFNLNVWITNPSSICPMVDDVDLIVLLLFFSGSL
ncbi:hypothetical protein Tco_1047742, partial [Tanacetum coccineum]